MIYLDALIIGTGLAMDATAVSMADGLNEPKMRVRKIIFIAFIFGLFQGVMPLIGYCAGTLFHQYINNVVPYIALVLLVILGVKMIVDGARNKSGVPPSVTCKVVLIQALATSIDALTVGVLYAGETLFVACMCFLIIAIVTFVLCLVAFGIVKAIRVAYSSTAQIVGGVILIAIGLKIFIEYALVSFA